MGQSKCDRCGEVATDIDTGFSPGVHEMGHNCGGTWRVAHTRQNIDNQIIFTLRERARATESASRQLVHAIDRWLKQRDESALELILTKLNEGQ